MKKVKVQHLYSGTYAALLALCFTDGAGVQPRPQPKPVLTDVCLVKLCVFEMFSGFSQTLAEVTSGMTGHPQLTSVSESVVGEYTTRHSAFYQLDGVCQKQSASFSDESHID